VEYPAMKATGTTGAERRATGFPAGFGGWTAAKLYEQSTSTSSNLQQQDAHQSDNTAASAARLEVGLNHFMTSILLPLINIMLHNFLHEI